MSKFDLESQNLPDSIDTDSIPTSQTANKSVCSSDSINTDTVQSETAIAVDSSGESEGGDKKKVSSSR